MPEIPAEPATKESPEVPTPPPPSFNIYDTENVAKIFPNGLPKIGDSVTLTFKVTGITDREGSDGKPSQSVDLQVSDQAPAAPGETPTGDGVLPDEPEEAEAELPGTLSADEEEAVLGYKRPDRKKAKVPSVGDLQEL